MIEKMPGTYVYEAILDFLKNVSQSILITLYYLLLCICIKIMSVCYVIVL